MLFWSWGNEYKQLEKSRIELLATLKDHGEMVASVMTEPHSILSHHSFYHI